MDNLWVQIGNYGFPMVIAFYILLTKGRKNVLFSHYFVVFFVIYNQQLL